MAIIIEMSMLFKAVDQLSYQQCWRRLKIDMLIPHCFFRTGNNSQLLRDTVFKRNDR
jgi:hypothetical protein